MAQFSSGDLVKWKSHGGQAVGKIVRKQTKDMTIKGHQVRASAEEPQYIVESDNGRRAAHKPSSLKKA